MDNYNVNRKVVNFKDFSGETEKEELQKVRRSTKPNSEDQQHVGNSRFKFNKVTRKMDDLSPEMIDDKIEAIEELEELEESLKSDELAIWRMIDKLSNCSKEEREFEINDVDLVYKRHQTFKDLKKLKKLLNDAGL